jgi:hypothetical protein
MLNADSSTLNRESDVQSRKAPPMIPSVAAFSLIVSTTRTMSSIDCEGNSRRSSSTR